MELLIDDANIEVIKKLYDLYPIDGVTTNPSILAKTKRDPKEVLTEIREFIGPESLLFVQATALNAEGIVKDAHAIVKAFGSNTIIKIPCIPEGFKAMKALKKEGIATCGTVVYTPLQAFIAAKSGAAYVAPYVNRIDNLGYDGVGTVKQMQDILDVHDMPTKILAASFKNSQQVLELCAYGIEACTAAGDVIENFVNNAAVDKAVEAFANDFHKLTGKDNMSDVL